MWMLCRQLCDCDPVLEAVRYCSRFEVPLNANKQNQLVLEFWACANLAVEAL
jgi:hypothetical protein